MEIGLKLLYYKSLNDRYYGKKGIKINRFNFFPQVKGEYINSAQKEYQSALQLVYDVLFKLYPLNDYKYLLDSFYIDIKKRKLNLKEYFSKFSGLQYSMDKFLSVLIPSEPFLKDFINTFCPMSDQIYIRLLDIEEKSLESGFVKDQSLKESHESYLKKLDLYKNVVCLSMNPLFVEVFSVKSEFDNFERILCGIGKSHHCLVEKNKKKKGESEGESGT